MSNPWFDFAVQATRISWDAQLRFLNFAIGGDHTRSPTNVTNRQAESLTSEKSVQIAKNTELKVSPPVATKATESRKKSAKSRMKSRRAKRKSSH